MSRIHSTILFFLSLFVVGYGQPALLSWLGPISAACGFALVFIVIEKIESPWRRFFVGTLWFTLVQLIQLYWFTSHPFIYIYLPYTILSLAVGLQFGLLSLLIRPTILRSVLGCMTVAALWTLMEWSRVFVLSGFSWNPIGLTLSVNDYSRQLASVCGVFGLSFWVMFTNALALRSLIAKTMPFMWMIAVLFPYFFGALHITAHTQLSLHSDSEKTFRVLLVQTGNPVDEPNALLKPENLISSVIDQWQQIVETLHEYHGKKIDMIVLPEFVVPFGTYPFAYRAVNVYKVFGDVCGHECLKSLPHLTSPYAAVNSTRAGPQMMVNNAYWAQAIANIFQTSVLIGLEDADDDSDNHRHHYNSAVLFHQQKNRHDAVLEPLLRYEKRVLVPMGEYIPFVFCQKIAARYGILSSFTCGCEAKIMHVKGVPFSPSICYEETFSDIVREGRKKGANLLVNLTSDAWYPNSTLPLQHFEHARLRTVENGVPLVRACNNGVTGGIDCFGRVIDVLGGDHPEDVEWTQAGILIEVPLKHYWTLYAQTGDAFIVVLSLLIILFGIIVEIYRTRNKT